MQRLKDDDELDYIEDGIRQSFTLNTMEEGVMFKLESAQSSGSR